MTDLSPYAVGVRDDVANRMALVGDDVLALAELASLSTLVTPDLLRAMRLEVLPRLDAGHEADVWWSPLVMSRGTDAATFGSEIARALRRRLRQRWLDGDPQVAAAHRVADMFRPEKSALRLEQELIWLAVSGGAQASADIENAIDQAIYSLVADGRTGLATWWRAAWSRLPDEVRSVPAARQLTLLSAHYLGPDALPIRDIEGARLDERIASALRTVPDVSVGIRRAGPILELGIAGGAESVAIQVPDTNPHYLELERGDRSVELLALTRDEVLSREVGGGTVWLRTARGAVFEIRADLSSPEESLIPPSVPPLGATYDGRGATFAVYTGAAAERVQLCLFDGQGRETRLELSESGGGIWATRLPTVELGQRYGYRVHGPYDPERGLRCNPAKLLVDPYAKAVDGPVVWDAAVFGYAAGDTEGRNDDDSARFVPKSVVVSGEFDWGSDRAPRVPYHESVIYEAHVRGLSVAHPEVPEALRGTFAGLAHPAVVEHLLGLGVTAVELLPVQEFVNDYQLQQRGLSNYWGYNTLAYLAPHHGYAAAGARPGSQVQEFKAMVRDLHQAGIEVILDVVYGHTAESDHLGPTLSLRGIDNAAYYQLVAGDERRYVDYIGAGNSLNVRNPHTLQLIMDSLRYWVVEMHVDGFRFNSAPTLAREFSDVDRLSAFFDLVQQDPVVSQVKLIAEPWDVGPGGYQVGNFPPLWSEWNGRYRDTVRDFWRGEPGMLGEFASRIAGSSDIYQVAGRRPNASINFVTSHDGFTLRDLVSFDEKHNEANGEDGRDGESDNRSWNCGVEGPTDDAAVLALRDRQQRNFIATLMLSQGVPMLLHGDEMGRTQLGNNNAYCQDNPISWVDWSQLHQNAALTRLVADLTTLRRKNAVLRGESARHGGANDDFLSVPDIRSFGPDGLPLAVDPPPSAKAMMVFLCGRPRFRRLPSTPPAFKKDMLLIFNAHTASVEFRLPPRMYGGAWTISVGTDDRWQTRIGESVAASDRLEMGPLDVLALVADTVTAKP